MKTIYYNGRVYTGTLPLVQAFAVEGDKFLFAGSDADALALLAEGDEKVDLGGKFVCAGFNDSHMHLLNYGQSLNMAPLFAHTTSLEEMLGCLREFIAVNPGIRGEWVMGRGWNQDYFSDVKRMPTRWDLDKVSSEIPICAVRACGHALVLNSKAIELVGVTAETPQPEGGQIVMENGEPNGIFFDNAMEPVYEAIPAPSKEDLKNMIRSACKALNAYGVTSSQSDDYCVFRTLGWKDINAAYEELEREGELTVRVYQQSNFTDLPSLTEFVEAGNVTGAGSEFFKIGPLKMLGDGALGARTAYLTRPYADDPTTCGIPVFTQEVFDELIGYANDHDMQVAVHTIGDACLDDVLSAIEKALSRKPREDHRHGIVHCQISRGDQLKKMAEMKLHIYAQSIFLDYDINIVEKRVGEELASTSYSWKTLKDNGASVSNGTDCPVELPFAMGGIQCAVTRCNLKGDIGPYLPHEAFSVQEALDSYTSAGAYASFEESVKGKIEAGMLADFVVLGDDPFTVDVNAIKDIPVCATYVGGKKVFEA